MNRRMSFRVVEPPPAPKPDPIAALMMDGAAVLSWAVMVGLVWTAYVVCVAFGGAS